MNAMEINFDGIVGPTHNYAALSFGNIASMQHEKWVSSPKMCALQGLKKMKLLMDLGVPQAVLPPQERPLLNVLHALGFKGKNALEEAAKTPSLLEAVSSASSMWAANAATITPSSDSGDGKVHFTIANLLNRFHRSLEARETYRLFSFLFSNEDYFSLHPPFPKGGDFGDEGAANHVRFCHKEGEKGVHLFVYGKSAFEERLFFFPARQAKEASYAIARSHGTRDALFARQNPKAIEAGIFHNDVISLGHHLHFLYHEEAFDEGEKIIQALREKTLKVCGKELQSIKVTNEILSLKQAVESYFFNSQLITSKEGKTILIAPTECRALDLSWLPFPIEYIDIRQSMQNGGGPACLRLQVVLTPEEKKAVHPYIFLTDALYRKLCTWVENHYRDRLTFSDLKDPKFVSENQTALDDLTEILQLGSFYSFQKEKTCL